jgi:CubicO group peptidase (beta-lactamase class C family)
MASELLPHLLRLGGLVAVGGLCLGGAPAAGQGDASADHALYMKRVQAYGARTGLESYDFLEAVTGAASPRPLAVAQAAGRSVGEAGLAAATRYAQAANSSAFLVWRAGSLQAERYFGANTATTPLISRSLAKPLSAIAVGRAIALGKIRSLDQPVADFIPEWRGTPKAKILVRHLLDMRSGLLAQGFSGDPANIWSRAYLDPHHGDILINEYPLVDPPGTRFAYSNATADLVALVIERATGGRYAAFISEQVLKPLGAAGGSVWVDRPGGLAHSGCCILLPAQTWMKLGVLLLQDGRWDGSRLLPDGYVQAMRTPTPQNPNYGLGVYIAGAFTPRRGFMGQDDPGPKVLHGEPYLADDLFLFDGAADQVLYLVPSAKLAILRTGATPPKTPEWDNAVLPNTILRALKP